MATIKVVFQEPDGQYTMLFGDSYKKWQEQYSEYVRMFKAIPLHAYKSKSPWKGWGGLKWCREEDFQKELNREDVQNDEPDNPKPRQYSQVVFEPMSIDKLPTR